MESQHQPVQVTPVQPPRSGAGIGAWFAVFFAAALLISVGFNLILLALNVKAPAIALSPNQKYREVLVDGDIEADKAILVIDITGPIYSGDEQTALGTSVAGIVTRTISQLRAAQEDADIKAIILNINTPGGGVDASETIYNEVMKTKEAGGVDGKKILVQMNDVTASGGYYISAASDWIVAHPTTITGSIGVIMQFPLLHKALDHLNIEIVTLTAGSKKNWGSSYDPFESEEREYLQNILDHMYDRFVDIVAKGRGKEKEEVLTLATGEIFLAEQAMELGLVDQIGFIDDTYEKARELMRDSGAKIIRYESATSFFAQLMGAEAPPVNIELGLHIDVLEALDRVPRFLFMWSPGY